MDQRCDVAKLLAGSLLLLYFVIFSYWLFFLVKGSSPLIGCTFCLDFLRIFSLYAALFILIPPPVLCYF